MADAHLWTEVIQCIKNLPLALGQPIPGHRTIKLLEKFQLLCNKWFNTLNVIRELPLIDETPCPALYKVFIVLADPLCSLFLKFLLLGPVGFCNSIVEPMLEPQGRDKFHCYEDVDRFWLGEEHVENG